MNSIKEMDNKDLYKLYKEIGYYLDYLKSELEKMTPKE